MRPRVHRHLAGQLMTLQGELNHLPDHPILTLDYLCAREYMVEYTSIAMKHSMQALTYMRRAEHPLNDTVVNRKYAAASWWGFRRAIRKARFYEGAARVLLMWDQEHI